MTVKIDVKFGAQVKHSALMTFRINSNIVCGRPNCSVSVISNLYFVDVGIFWWVRVNCGIYFGCAQRKSFKMSVTVSWKKIYIVKKQFHDKCTKFIQWKLVFNVCFNWNSVLGQQFECLSRRREVQRKSNTKLCQRNTETFGI